ncbi:unnamed protein product, partial [marine sediment metagenome]
GDALKLIPELQYNFDLVFIDAAKYEYPQYIKTLENKLESGALIIADNIFYKNKIFKRGVDMISSSSEIATPILLSPISNPRILIFLS